jgi:uncharacterized repeat protein (TIGR01451 family)
MKHSLIIVLIILFIENPIASSYSTNDIEWAPAKETTLYRGNNFTNGIYTVIAAEFPTPVPGFKKLKTNEILPETPVSPVVYLEIYKNSALIKEIVLTPRSSNEIDPDYEVKVSLTDILPGTSRDWVYEYYNPWAKVSISLRGKPKLEVTVTADKTNYVSSNDEILTATVNVKNTGDAVARGVEVYLDPGVLQLRGGSTSQFHQTYLELKKGETQSSQVILMVPKLAFDTTYPLNASVKGSDVKDIEYQASGSLAISVSPKALIAGVSVSKAVKNRMYLKDMAVFRVTVSNGGDFDLYNVRVKDSLNENFKLSFDSPLHWEIPVIKSGQDWSTTYSLRPLGTNLDGFTIPPANALFIINNKEYDLSSDSPSVIVNGPKIIINKTVDKQTVNINENITITVIVTNVGNIATKMQVVDYLLNNVSLVYLPDNVSLVSGQISAESKFLEVNEPEVFSYIIRPKRDGMIELPSAVANYTSIEYRGTVRSALSSDRTVINVIDPDKVNTSNNSGITGNTNLAQSDGQIPVTLPDTTPLKEETSENTPENAPEITATPITPFIDISLTILLLIFAAFLRRN